MAHREDAAEHRTKPPCLQPTVDRAATNAGGEELVAADDAVLAICQCPDHVVSGALSTHMVFKAPPIAKFAPTTGPGAGSAAGDRLVSSRPPPGHPSAHSLLLAPGRERRRVAFLRSVEANAPLGCRADAGAHYDAEPR